MSLFARLKSIFSRKKHVPRLGLALGSGGAKGTAHLGVLKAFEEEGLVFDVVSGASIGAIVGALYAKGYSSADMAGIVESLNRKEFARNLRPFADLEFAERFLGAYLEGDISQLPKPFAAAATDGATGESVALTEGKLVRALTASAAIPPFFRGVEFEGKKLYDGAFSDAIPADLCRSLGAEVVIGVDLGAFVRPEEERGRFSRMIGSAVGALVPVKYNKDHKSRGYDAADVMIKPDLSAFRPTDVGRAEMEEMYSVGYLAAKEAVPAIRAAIAAGSGKPKKEEKNKPQKGEKRKKKEEKPREISPRKEEKNEKKEEKTRKNSPEKGEGARGAREKSDGRKKEGDEKG